MAAASSIPNRKVAPRLTNCTPPFERTPNPQADSELDEFDTQAVRFKPESLDNLVKLTKFNKRELKLMYRGFKQVSSGREQTAASGGRQQR